MDREQLCVQAIQAPLHWQDVEANLAHFQAYVPPLGKADLVLLPEMFTTGFTMEPAEVGPQGGVAGRLFLVQSAKASGASFGGSCMTQLEDGTYVNRFYLAHPDGRVDAYDKWHRFAMAGEDQAYATGDRQPVIVQVAGWRLLLQVCYDLRFPVYSRNPIDAPYDAIAYVANWPEPRRHHWRTLLQARAIENQAYVVGVNRLGTDAHGHRYVGDSMIVDPLGTILADGGVKPGLLEAVWSKSALTELRERLPFLRDADRFGLL